MQFSFFTPTLKVHKQRNLLRKTDTRLSRYSIRGLGVSILILVLSLFLGEYYQQHPVAASIFVLGVVLISIFRVYYLVRFVNLYSRGPSRWRNIYFSLTMVHAAWWGMMLATITYSIGIKNEVPLLWFYSIAFISSCSHVFSAYKRFYSLYIYLALLPCSIVAIFSLSALESVYGVIMLLLVFLLRRQGEVIGSAYWSRMQANYDLTQRANALEAEKISSESSLSNKDTLFMNLADELKTSLREILDSLKLLKLAKLPKQEEVLVDLAEQKSRQQIHMLQNVLEFSYISRDEVLLDSKVIDLRGVIEKSVTKISSQVYKKEIEIFSRYSTDFPLRVRADAERLEQIIINIINSVIAYANKGCLILNADYSTDDDKQDILTVEITIDKPYRTVEIEQQLLDAFKPHYANDMSQGLSLAIANGLAICMQGRAGAGYTSDGHLKFWFNAVVPMVTPINTNTQKVSKLYGKHILLYQPPKIIEDEYINTLESWGLIVEVTHDEREAIDLIKLSQSGFHPIDVVLIYTRIQNLESLSLSKIIPGLCLDSPVSQLLCVSENQCKLPGIEELVQTIPNVELIRKPIEHNRLRKKLKYLLINDIEEKVEEASGNFLKNKSILLLQNEDIDRTIAEVMLKKLGCLVTTVKTVDEATVQFEKTAYDAFITDVQLVDDEMKSFIELAKSMNVKLHAKNYILPALGLCHHEQEGEETRCLQFGMDYYIDAPLKIDDLTAILRRWIGRAIHLSESK
jgi:signal transduction histidine kinase/CheY-like chemotaxis protein